MIISRTLTLLAFGVSSAWAWTIDDRANNFPGQTIEIRHDGRLVAELVHGDGQFKPYVSVYDEGERRLTNPGMDADGELLGRFPHHRGIFIGWNHIDSDLGRDDLWHLRRGEQMRVVAVESRTTTAQAATLELSIHWFSSRTEGDEQGGLLVAERRTLVVSRNDGRTQIDQHSELTAARDLRLGGDLQHAGLHFRADAAVDEVRGETRYLWAPAELAPGNGRIISPELEWVNFRFPLHGQWYSVTQLNRPENRVTELSWRDYGRFGFFFQDDLKAGESRSFHVRFLIDEGPAVGEDGAIRAAAHRDQQVFLQSGEE
jgi:hypothetical protein